MWQAATRTAPPPTHTHTLLVPLGQQSRLLLDEMKFESDSCLCVIISQLRIDPVESSPVQLMATYSSLFLWEGHRKGSSSPTLPLSLTLVSDYKFNVLGFLWAGYQAAPTEQLLAKPPKGVQLLCGIYN